MQDLELMLSKAVLSHCKKCDGPTKYKGNNIWKCTKCGYTYIDDEGYSSRIVQHGIRTKVSEPVKENTTPKTNGKMHFNRRKG